MQLLDIESDETVTYRIVGDDEADIKLGLISFSSPLARAIIGKREGDEVEFQAPGGKKEYCLLYTSPSPRDATLSRMPSSA